MDSIYACRHVACADVCMHVPLSASIFATMYVAGASRRNMMQRDAMPCNFNQYLDTYTFVMYVCNATYVRVCVWMYG